MLQMLVYRKRKKKWKREKKREITNVIGRLFRPDAEPLLPNWTWLPVGYHGRASSVVSVYCYYHAITLSSKLYIFSLILSFSLSCLFLSFTLVVNGTPIRRPWGQVKPPTAQQPSFVKCGRLDFELEMVFYFILPFSICRKSN